MGRNKISTQRHNSILEELYKKGDVEVKELSKQFGVNAITIRRDLDLLADRQLLTRVHGGAVVSNTTLQEHLYGDKLASNHESKCRIAEKAAEFIQDNTTIFLNSGSTTAEIMHYIGQKNVKVITNNVAITAIDYPSEVEVFLTGGEYRPTSKSLVGDVGATTLQTVFSACTFIGANGLSVEEGVTTFVQQETTINQLMIARTHGPVILTVDSSKLGVVSNFITASIDSFDIIITDNGADEKELEKLKKTQKNIIIV